MTDVRELLRNELERRVRSRGLVVWQDEHAEYAEVAESVVPKDAAFAAYRGSWYELRRRVEDLVAGDRPPRLVIYAGARPAPDDPLAELRDAGSEFKRRLATLLRDALSGKMPDARIKEISRQARTLVEAEAAIGAGARVDARLISLLGTADLVEIAMELLRGDRDPELTQRAAWPLVHGCLKDAFGLETDLEGEELRKAIVRQLLLAEITHALGELPAILRPAWHEATDDQVERSIELLRRLAVDPRTQATYRRLAREADKALAFGSAVRWHPALEKAKGTPSLESAAIAHAAAALAEGDAESAATLARNRLLESPWIRDDTGISTQSDARWRAVLAVADLQEALRAATVPAGGVGDLLRWYADAGWKVDRAHRRLELVRTELRTLDQLNEALTKARVAYDEWLDQVLSRFSAALPDYDIDALLRQDEIYERFVARGDSDGLVAYVWVDALRYELGQELAHALEATGTQADVHPAVAAAPTLTPVGMANLAPGAGTNLKVEVAHEKLVTSIGEVAVRTVRDRVDLLRARHGNVVDLELDDVVQADERWLAEKIEGADLVLVRSREVDAAGESGHLAVAWAHFETVTSLLATLVARLAQAGVTRIVITADHGFIALGRELQSDRVLDAPVGSRGLTKRRVFIGQGGETSDVTVRLALASTGMRSDADLILPKGLAVFRAGGGKQFLHGGLSPQELLVPVVVVDVAESPDTHQLEVEVAIAGGRVATGAFSASLTFAGDLFTRQVDVRAVARRRGDDLVVARPVSGDFDPETGTTHVTVDKPAILTFQVTMNLAAGDEIELQVLDAQTGRVLGLATADVATPVVVEDDLD